MDFNQLNDLIIELEEKQLYSEAEVLHNVFIRLASNKYATLGEFNWKSYLGDAAKGALSGGLTSMMSGEPFIGAGVAGGINAGKHIIKDFTYNRKPLEQKAELKAKELIAKLEQLNEHLYHVDQTASNVLSQYIEVIKSHFVHKNFQPQDINHKVPQSNPDAIMKDHPELKDSLEFPDEIDPYESLQEVQASNYKSKIFAQSPQMAQPQPVQKLKSKFLQPMQKAIKGIPHGIKEFGHEGLDALGKNILEQAAHPLNFIEHIPTIGKGSVTEIAIEKLLLFLFNKWTNFKTKIITILNDVKKIIQQLLSISNHPINDILNKLMSFINEIFSVIQVFNPSKAAKKDLYVFQNKGNN